jgi:putative ABC transport system permease protein
MLRVALSALRNRWVSFAGAFVALALGTGLVAMMITTLFTASTVPFPGPQRFAAAPAVVVPSKTVTVIEDGAPEKLPVLQPGGLTTGVVTRLAATGRTVVDRTFPAQRAGGPSGQVGHAWSGASFTPYRLTRGRAPVTDGEIVIGGGNPDLVGRRVPVTTSAGTSTYTVTGVTAPVWFEQAIFFSDASAARISPQSDAVVAYGPLDAVRQAAAAGPTQVLTGSARKAADPDPSGGTDELMNTVAAAGTSTGLGICVALFVMIGTFAFVTDQRRRELGLLRTVGATPRQVRRMIIIEAAALGIVASATGCGLGLLGARPLQTWMIDHQVAPTWFTIHITVPPLIIAFAIGLASAIVGSVASSWRSARVRPTEALRDAAVNRRIMSIPRWLFGVGLLALGIYVGIRTIIKYPSDALTVKNDLAAFVPIIAGFALLAPVILKPVTRIATWPLGHMGAGSLVVRQNTLTGGRRTAASVAPIVLALGLAATMLTLEAVANASHNSAVRQEARADFVVAPANGTELSPQAVAAISRIPDADVAVFRAAPIILANDKNVYIDTLDNSLAVDPAALTATQRLTPVAGSLSRLGHDFLIVDQSTALADGLIAGQHVRAYLPDGTPVRLRVAAVIRTGVTDQTAYLGATSAGDGPPIQIDVTVQAGTSRAIVGAALRAAARGYSAEVTPIGAYLDSLRSAEESQTRQATTVILGIALIYGLIAVASTLVTAAVGRKREIAALSLAGATRRQTLRFIAAEAALLTGIGAILATAATVITVIGQVVALNRFAGAATLSIPWALIFEITALCAAVAVTASVLAEWRVLQGTVGELADLRE